MTLDPERYRLAPGRTLRLAEYDASDTGGLDRDRAAGQLTEGVERMAELQERLFAHRRWAVLLVLQGMDASGKDGAIKRLAAGMNPQGFRVTSFGAPTSVELAHDFLWRIHQAVPARGSVGVFNRSHYEDVLVPRADAAVRAKLGLPAERMDEGLWERRLADIAAFERSLSNEGVVVVKAFLHISREEQRERLLARIDDPEKHWKFDTADYEARDLWADYHAAYEAAITATNVAHAPWYIIPADHKWLARLAVQQVMLGALESLDLERSPLSPAVEAAMQEARQRLKG